ncbi:exodeoxyribonuclease VIII [Leclercia adecarboxylata]|uniref:Exodeoxyribonuclease VIII n=1 Tax=Leclercia adecarboxylata TaxID=83655 RepID=A0AAP9IS62_9ENTR|nr:RecE family exodeoxyribonuclease [Leclercia adecarboxylata]QDK20877.1 exodeoxyribonuclease VIII [Leclercia adecarboxylata]
MEFFYLVKATQKSGKPDAVVWLSANTQSRAALQLDVALEDAGIETGRGKDYAKPVRTDFPVFNDLPEESTIDYTWCERYTLADDQRTWNVIPGAAQLAQPDEGGAEGTDTTVVDGVDIETGEIVGDVNSTETVCDAVREFRERELPVLTTVATLPFRQRLLAQYIADKQYFYHVDEEQKKAIQVLELDVDNSYVQNMILAAENVEGFKKAHEPDIWKVVSALKTIFPVDGKRTELSVVIQFFKAWFSTEHIDRGILTREWAAGNRISSVQRTDAGTNADGGYVTDRGEGAHHTLDTLDLEIACALLPMDFHHFEIPSSVLRRAKEIVATKEEPWKSWSKILRNQPGVLAVNRAAIFNLVRIAPENIHLTPVAHLEFVNQTMTAEFNAATELMPLPIAQPEADTQTAEEHPLPKWTEAGEQKLADESEAETQTLPKWAKETISQPQVANLGGGMFSIEGLMNENKPQTDDRSPVKEETTSDVQMEETDPPEGESIEAVQPGESADAADPQTVALNPAEVLAAAVPELANATAPEVTTETPEETAIAPEYPAYFEPGRYEGLPNNVYHAANGISSTQVKDARVSLMFYHGRHVTKTIRRESSEALTFGSLAHTLALEPEKLHEEFAVFPGVPEGAFTTTDSMKAFIREFNADKPKAEQLKLTGKKEELQAAIRAVYLDAIFADEYEQQWRDSVAGKAILSSEQLALATAIQQALLNHKSAGKLLRHPSRSVETSYFGMDDETGLEVRVRPDLEVEINGVRIGVDLKTISMGRIKQDGLRAKLHREIIDRDYHLSAGMYCDVADFDQFFWIFVNKDEGYHWVAVIEASEDLLALGMQEYQKTMRALAQAYDTNCWPAPITEDYIDELNDFDLRRLEALRLA